MFKKGESYSAINTARSALSAILCNDSGLTIGKFISVKRFMKGVFELKPPLPRYNDIWDANIVIDFLKTFYPNSNLPLSILTYKLVMLLALSSSQRAQTLRMINVKNVKFYSDYVDIPIYGLMKQMTARNRKFTMKLKVYPHDKSICVVEVLREYLERTEPLRTSEQFSLQKPHGAVTTQTISRWLKKVLLESGIDISIYKPHSTRAASVSRAKADSVDVNEILKTAGWTNNRTFEIFYNKIIND